MKLVSKNPLLLLLSFLVFLGCAGGQVSLWEDTQSSPEEKPNANAPSPSSFRMVKVHTEHIRKTLESAGDTIDKAVTISLPTPNNNEATFQIWNSGVISPELQKKFPKLGAFQGVLVGSTQTTCRLDLTTDSFRFFVLDNTDPWFIEAYNRESNLYMVFTKSSLPEGAPAWHE